MSITVDISYKSLHKFHEELCGDKVELLKTDTSTILILADGMGSGVKANILATLTSKILGTMFLNGASLEECVQTIVKTLPVCKVRQVAYSTFSILQIFPNKDAYLVEFDNPACVFIRDHALVSLPYMERIIEGKKIRECRFQVEKNDCLILMSDGVIHAGVGKSLNFGWTWDHMANYAAEATKRTLSSSRLVSVLCKACDDLYLHAPGDDTTIAVVRIIPAKPVHLFTGPPLNKDEDAYVVSRFMEGDAKKIISGGTSANIVARVLHREIHTTLNYVDPAIPPTATMEGMDLVTEGVLTLTRTLTLMKRYVNEPVDEDFFTELDQLNGGSMIAKILIEDCTDLHLFVGKTINEAHQNPAFPFDLSIRMNLVAGIIDAMKKMGKTVTVEYY